MYAWHRKRTWMNYSRSDGLARWRRRRNTSEQMKNKKLTQTYLNTWNARARRSLLSNRLTSLYFFKLHPTKLPIFLGISQVSVDHFRISSNFAETFRKFKDNFNFGWHFLNICREVKSAHRSGGFLQQGLSKLHQLNISVMNPRSQHHLSFCPE